MTAALDRRAEILKLARLLGTEPARLRYLEKLAPDDVRLLRERATDALFDSDRRLLQRVAASSRRVPASVAATIAQRAFRPLLSARVTGFLDPHRAVDIAERVPVRFLADVAVQLDPRRASDIIARMPVERTVAVARALLRRGEHIAMGRYVGHLSDETLAAAAAAMDDPTVLRVAFVIEEKGEIDRVLDLFGEERLRGLVRAAAEHDLWPEALSLLSHVSDRRRAELGELAASEDDEVLDAMVGAAHEQDLWDALLPMARTMSEDSRRRFARLPTIRRDGVLESIAVATARHELWAELLPLVPLLTKGSQRRLAASAGELSKAQRRRAAREARELGVLDRLGPLREALEV